MRRRKDLGGRPATGEADEKTANGAEGNPFQDLSASPVLSLNKMDEEASDR